MITTSFPKTDNLYTLGPAYSEVGYDEHPVTTSRFFSCVDIYVIDTNVKEARL